MIKLRAERRLGEMLSALDLPKGGAPKQKGTNPSHDARGSASLGELGITYSESSRSQRIAKLPERAFEKFLQQTVGRGREPTTAALLRLPKQRDAKRNRRNKRRVEGVVLSLFELVDVSMTFQTIYADPPWPYENQATRASTNGHYPTMALEELCAEPVEQIAAENAHLHLWATSSMLPHALEVMEAWGFAYKSSFIWVKPKIGLGNFWRLSHEFLLLGVRGNAVFADRGQRSWIEADRTRHSEKPDEVRQVIEKVSPSPYLEMYGRQARPGWTVHGDQVRVS